MALMLALAAASFSWDQNQAVGQPVSSDPVFSGLTISDQTVTGRIVRLTEKTITLATPDQADQELPLESLIRLSRERPGSVAAPSTPGGYLLFPGGDRLAKISIGAVDETTLTVHSQSSIGKVQVPIESILGVIFTVPADPAAFDHLRDQFAGNGNPRATEQVWLANGDILSGGYMGMDAREIKLQVEGKTIDLDRSTVVALGFDPNVVNYPRPSLNHLEILLTDGSRLGVTEASLEKGQLQAKSRFGQSLRIPVSEIVQFVPLTDAVTYLSDLKPDAERYISYVGPTRPFQTNRTVEGHPFLLEGKSYERGIGTQSRTILGYKLRPGDRRFQAIVGVDDRAGPLGSVVFRVLVDGKVKATTPALSSKDQPQSIDVEITGAKDLILITEFGERGDIRDIADWIEARIIR